MLRSIRTVLHGALPEEWSGVSDATGAWRRLPFALLAGGLLFLGVFPSTVTRRVQPALARVVEQARPKAAKAAVAKPEGNAAGSLAATVAGR
jgi:NADH:ubiquinone oxidoreductase subunit 4 (subunit M)